MTNDKTERPSMAMISKNQKTFDAIIVGGGHNGLVAASYLAKAGKAVLLLEAHDELGGIGLRQSREQREQFRHTAEPDEEHAGGIGIERPRMTGPLLSQRSSALRHDVVTCPPGGLVNDE